MASLANVFVVGALVHAVASLAFAGVALCASGARRRFVASLSTLVVALTAAVYAAQSSSNAPPVGAFVRAGDGRTQFAAEWIGYTASLALIGYAFAFSLNAPAPEQALGALTLAFVGGGGVLGLFVAVPGIQVAVAAATTLMYALFFGALARSARRARRTWLLVAFGVVTAAFYVVPYVLGPPAANAIGATPEHVLYLIGNVVTKIALPVYEIVSST